MVDPKGFLKHDRWAPKPLPVPERVAHFAEHYENYNDEQVRTQAGRCMDCGVPFCMSGCPLGNLIPDWNDYVHQGRWQDALHALHATNNFPEFTGRVCPAPCEHSCVLGINAPPVSIKLMEQAIVDKGFAEGWVRPQKPPTRTGKKVAVIGAGPAGMACAQQLNRAGHEVTVFERADRAGGLMTYGIPDYKLRKEKVQRRVDQLIAEGVAFRFNAAVGSAALPWNVIRAGHDAVVLAIGCEMPRAMALPGRELAGIHYAMEFLPQCNRRTLGDAEVAALHPSGEVIEPAGKHVLVIGGGDTASDCIGNCLRRGAASVTNFNYHNEGPKERPADNPWPQYQRVQYVSSSHEELLALGGAQEFGLNATRFAGDEHEHVTGLETVGLDWSQGRPAREIAGSQRTWRADLVLIAIGYQGVIKSGLVAATGIELDSKGAIATDPMTRMTNQTGVFAAGDARRGQSLVVWAIAEGREVAHQVDAWLNASESLLPSVRLEAYAY